MPSPTSGKLLGQPESPPKEHIAAVTTRGVWPSFFSSMTKFSSLARAQVIGPGGAWGDGASGGAGEGAASVDVLVL